MKEDWHTLSLSLSLTHAHTRTHIRNSLMFLSVDLCSLKSLYSSISGAAYQPPRPPWSDSRRAARVRGEANQVAYPVPLLAASSYLMGECSYWCSQSLTPVMDDAVEEAGFHRGAALERVGDGCSDLLLT